ncbi:MAG: 1-acyl-sn-glycerol-3-phosphate acyltransferase, partial [Deltaproteobacteria bacterium]|nr:1-acyl-sn-glycerol-3-phosphate acyltransferase [Deltaproteobacteria bacterium]
MGRDHIPFGQPYMVVANHRSWVDVITLIWAARAEGLSKREVFFTPVMGVLGYLGGAVFFNRDHAEGRRRAKEECLFLLKQGVPLHIYPEGTRTR